MVLHLLNKSPHGSDACSSLLRAACSGDSVLLLEDGVYGATNDDLLAQRGDLVFYALRADVEARGLLDQLTRECTVVDHEGFVELTERCHSVASWL